MRQPKHRHHPDIWRERHLAHELGRRRWFGRGVLARERDTIMATQDAIAVAVRRGTFRPAPRTLTEADFLAALHDVWNDGAPLGMDTPYTPGRVR